MHLRRDSNGVLDMSVSAVEGYAVNGAVHYARHITEKSSFKQVFAVGVSGDEKHHRITPLYIDDREGYKQLDDLESFVSFSRDNVREYYVRNVLEEATDSEKTTESILKDAAELHEALRTYGSLADQDKPLVVAGILLALNEVDHKGFSIRSLTADDLPGMRDGDKILKAIENQLRRSRVAPDAKRDKLVHEFQFIADNERLNEKNDTLGKTPLRHFAEFLNDRVFRSLRYQRTSEDFIGRFYGEFMRYSGGDGQSLGIVLTPRHICDLMCELVEVGPEDTVLDHCCGTGGFLISAMHKMLQKADSEVVRSNIRKERIHGIEMQSKMFATAVANMILRGDGKANIQCADFLRANASELQLKGASVGLMNPPYSQGSSADPNQYEISFVEHLLDSCCPGARVAVIVPQSSMTGKTNAEKERKRSIMARHTLEGVITCNTEAFYGVGTNPVIAVFTAGEPHDSAHLSKFVDFRNDGYEVHAHVGLVEGDSAKDKRAHLLDVWRNNIEAESRFCVESTVEADDEWLHSFYYFNDAIPTDADFDKAIGEYLTFELSMVMQNREYLFEKKRLKYYGHVDLPALEEKDWNEFVLGDLFEIKPGKRLENRNKIPGDRPFVGACDNCNGITGFVGNENISLDKNVLGVNYNGAPCIAFYHPYECLFTDDVKRLHLKNWSDGEAILLFFTVIFAQQRGQFSYGYKFNEQRMKRQKLRLPVDEFGKPDYSYMEQYAKNTLLRKYRQYIVHLESMAK